jgi:hypothetical protein
MQTILQNSFITFALLLPAALFIQFVIHRIARKGIVLIFSDSIPGFMVQFK